MLLRIHDCEREVKGKRKHLSEQGYIVPVKPRGLSRGVVWSPFFSCYDRRLLLRSSFCKRNFFKMSDEDRDIDIESDDDVDEEANTQFMTQAEKRAHHNALERKRRDHIKESFHNLRDSIPSVQGEKVGSKGSLQASRAQILKQATDYIQFMTKKNGTTQSDIDDLKKQNSLLEQQIRALEKAKTTSSFASQSSSLLSSGGKIGMAHDSESESSDTEVAGSRKKKLKTK